MQTEAQKKKREELKSKLIFVLKGISAFVLILIGFFYWYNGNRSADTGGGKVYSEKENKDSVVENTGIQDSGTEGSVDKQETQVTVTVTEAPEQKLYDDNGRLNINIAGKSELMKLNGIGEKRADDIIDYRNTNGAFTRIEDIMKVKGIKQGIFSKIKDYIFCP